jgi:hypothetical protein
VLGRNIIEKNLIKHVTVKIFCHIFTPSQKTITKFYGVIDVSLRESQRASFSNTTQAQFTSALYIESGTTMQ